VSQASLSFLSASSRARLRLFAVLTFLVSIIARVVYRGSYYPGWDALGPAHGLYLVSTLPFTEAVAEAFHLSRHFAIWNHINSALFTLIPGWLGRAWPWEYWAPLLTFVLFVLTLWPMLGVSGLRVRDGWVVLLAVGAAPALLSFAVAGYPFVTGFLPHALALRITLAGGLQRRWLATLALSLLVTELSWHVYPLGRTCFTVFAAAAFLQRGVPATTRGVWLSVACLQLAMIRAYSSRLVGDYVMWDSMSVEQIALALRHVGEALFVTQTLSIPLLFVVGLASFLFFRERRLLLLGLFAVQMGLVVQLGLIDATWIRPRRFIVVEFYCIVAILCMLAEDDGSRLRQRAKQTCVALLVVGNLWQLYDLVDYMRVPVREQRHPLPYTFSQADYAVHASATDWAHELRARVEAGERLLLIYNFDAYPENTTDMAAVLERLYLSLGHERFVESVFVFGERPCRYTCLPIRPINELAMVLDGIRADGPMPPESFTGFYTLEQVPATWGAGVFALEVARIFAEVRRHFVIDLQSPKDAYHMRFTIAAKPSPPPVGVLVDIRSAQYRSAHETMRTEWQGFPIDVSWYDAAERTYDSSAIPYLIARPWGPAPFATKLAGTLHVLESGYYNVLLGSDDDARITLNDTIIIDNGGMHPFHLTQRSMVLERGSYGFALEYEDFAGVARLVADIQRIDEGSPLGSATVAYAPVAMRTVFPAGLAGTYYESDHWSGQTKPTGEEVAVSISLDALWQAHASAPSSKPWAPQDHFSLRLEGEMVVPATGTYRIVLGSDDGATLYLGGTPVVDNGGVHPYREIEALVPLRKGPTSFRLDYFDRMLAAKLHLSMQRALPRKATDLRRP
jgi:hypothetical protein